MHRCCGPSNTPDAKRARACPIRGCEHRRRMRAKAPRGGGARGQHADARSGERTTPAQEPPAGQPWLGDVGMGVDVSPGARHLYRRREPTTFPTCSESAPRARPALTSPVFVPSLFPSLSIWEAAWHARRMSMLDRLGVLDYAARLKLEYSAESREVIAFTSHRDFLAPGWRGASPHARSIATRHQAAGRA
jgi:hypothetical protein